MSSIRTLPIRWLSAMLAVTILLLPDCSGRKEGRPEQKPSPVAQSGPALEPIRPLPPVPVRERVPSQGDCAPRYKQGGMGTCINNQPCRGFGVKAQNGSAICTCYGREGGCGEGQRCDALRLACIPETEPPSGRSRGEAD